MKGSHWWLHGLAVVALTAYPGRAADADLASIRKSMTFHASFDHGTGADVSKGDPSIYTILRRNPGIVAQPGIHADDMTRVVAGEGLRGGALRFTSREAKWLFYRAEKNLPFAEKDWSGTVSLWLKVDPQKELAPGYCDPIQITPRTWNDAAFFVDFDKAGEPRDFRLGAFADLSVWNAANRNVNDIPEDERPLVKVRNPPFSGEKWTHVVFTWEKFNTGAKDGVARLYLDGHLKGELTGWTQTFGWRGDEESRILVGLNYIGLFDELSCFDRSLSAGEIRRLTAARGLGPDAE